MWDRPLDRTCNIQARSTFTGPRIRLLFDTRLPRLDIRYPSPLVAGRSSKSFLIGNVHLDVLKILLQEKSVNLASSPQPPVVNPVPLRYD